MRRQHERDLLSESQEDVLQSNNEKLLEQASKYLNEIGLNDSESWNTSVATRKPAASAGGTVETSSVARRKSLNAISEDGSDYFTDEDSVVAMALRMNAADLDSVVSNDATISTDNRFGHDASGTRARSSLPSISEMKKMAKISEMSAPPPPKYRPARRPSTSHQRGEKNRLWEGERVAPDNLTAETSPANVKRERVGRRSSDGTAPSLQQAHWDADEMRRYRNRSSASPPRNIPRKLNERNREPEVERRRGSINGKKTLKLRNRKGKSTGSDDDEPMQGIGFNTRLPGGKSDRERLGSQAEPRRSRSQCRDRVDRSKSEKRSLSIPKRFDGTRQEDPPPAFPTQTRPNKLSPHHTNGNADDNSVYDSDDQTQFFYESTDDEFDSDDEPTLSVSEAVAEMNRHKSLKGLFGRFK